MRRLRPSFLIATLVMGTGVACACWFLRTYCHQFASACLGLGH